jgi:glycosyltransferase involved in cell wall biosynthesis
MLCGCVPVGTNLCGIPVAIGDTGFIVPVSDPKAAAAAIRKALESDKGPKARERIRTLFPIERRERELVQAVDGLTGKDVSNR